MKNYPEFTKTDFEICKERILSESPVLLKDLAARLHLSLERVCQLEKSNRRKIAILVWRHVYGGNEQGLSFYDLCLKRGISPGAMRTLSKLGVRTFKDIKKLTGLNLSAFRKINRQYLLEILYYFPEIKFRIDPYSTNWR